MGQYPSARAAAYADDGFVRDTLLTVLRILAADANDAIRSVISSHAELSSLQDMVSDEALLQLPHHRGGLGLTPACASSIAAFYTATARSVRWFSGLRDPTFWIKDDLSCPDTWTSSAPVSYTHLTLPTKA